MNSDQKFDPIIPDSPDAIAEFLIDAANYMTFFEEKYLLPLKKKHIELKTKIDALSALIDSKRSEYIAKHMDAIPKTHTRSTGLMYAFVDHHEDNAIILEAVEERAKLIIEESETRSQISRCDIVLSQYERAIKASITKLS